MTAAQQAEARWLRADARYRAALACAFPAKSSGTLSRLKREADEAWTEMMQTRWYVRTPPEGPPQKSSCGDAGRVSR